MKRLVITGCNGYLGRHLCREFVAKNQVLGVARAGHNLSNLKSLGIKCCTYENLSLYLQAGDVFIHCAGKTGNVGKWEDFKTVNVDWSAELFELASKRGIKCFIYVSSVAAFGYKNRPGYIDELTIPDLCEGEFYGRSKLMADRTLERLAKKVNTRLVILRAGLIYGRRPVLKTQSWFRRGFVIDLNERVPLVHIDNFYDALAKIVEAPDVNGTFLVVGDEQPCRRELIRIQLQTGILKYRPWRIGQTGFTLMSFGKTFFKWIVNKKTFAQSGSIEAALRFYCRKSIYNCNLLKKTIDWFPHVSFEEGWLKVAELLSRSDGDI